MKMDAKFEKLEMKIRQAETSEINADAVEAIVSELKALRYTSDVERFGFLKRRVIELIDNRKRLLLGERALLLGEVMLQ